MAQAIRLAINTRKLLQPALNIEYIALDDSDEETGEWSSTKELANAQTAANDPSVIAYIGPYNSGAAMVSIPVTNRAGLVQVSPSATWPGLTESGYNPGEPDIYYPAGARSFISMMPPDSLQAKAAANWVSKKGIDSVAVLNDGSSYSIGLTNSFDRYAGSKAKARLQIDPSDLSDLQRELGNVQAVFYAPSSVQNALKIAHALHGFNVLVLATDVALDPQFVDGAGEDAAKWLVISNTVPDPPLFDSEMGTGSELSENGPGAKFKSQFKAAYGTFPGQFAANSYDITNRILDALAEVEAQHPGAGPDRAGVLKYVQSGAYEGATGTIKFTSEGRPANARMSGYRWREGRFQLAEILPVYP